MPRSPSRSSASVRSSKGAKRAGIRVRGYVSTAFFCPYEGRTPPARAVDVCRRLLDLGCDELDVGDTIGAATPPDVAALLDLLLPHVAGRARGPPLPRHARHGPRQRGGGSAPRRHRVRRERGRARAAVRSPRAPRATSRPRTSSTCSTGSASRPASISSDFARRGARSRRRSGARSRARCSARGGRERSRSRPIRSRRGRRPCRARPPSSSRARRRDRSRSAPGRRAASGPCSRAASRASSAA